MEADRSAAAAAAATPLDPLEYNPELRGRRDTDPSAQLHLRRADCGPGFVVRVAFADGVRLWRNSAEWYCRRR